MPKEPAPASEQEQARLEALRRYEILDTPPESAYDDVVRLAAAICDTPIALLTLVDEDRQWFKSKLGLSVSQTPREVAFCSRAIAGTTVMQVRDARVDARFADNPLVTGEPHIVFYAGAPLVTPDGYRIGTVCVIDHRPRELNEEQTDALAALSSQVIANLELRRTLAMADRARQALADEVRFRNAAETARRLSDSFMRATIDSLRDNIAIVDSRGDIVHVNRSWAEFAENNCPEELLDRTGPGVNYLAVCDRAVAANCAHAAEVGDAMRRILAGDDAQFTLEYPCHSPKEQRWYVVRITAFSCGADRHAVVTHRNVTARRRADAQVRQLNTQLEKRVAARTADLEQAYATLHASEEKLRSLFENARLGVLVLGADGSVLNANDAFLEMTGSARETTIGSNFLDCVDDEDRVLVATQMNAMIDGGLPGCELELRSRLFGEAYGAWRHVSMSAVHDRQGNVHQVMALVQPLSGERETELQRDRFFRHSVDMLVIADLDGRLHRCNPASERILGYTEDELCSMNYLDLVHPDDRAHAAEEISRLQRGEDVEALEVRMRHRGGEYRQVAWTATPWTSEGLMLANGRDVTRRRAAERTMREQQRMLERAEQLAELGSWHYDLAGRRVFCSAALQRIAGREPVPGAIGLDELLGFVVGGDRRRLRQAIRAVADDGKPARIRVRLQRTDGEIRLLQVSMDVARDPSAGTYAVIGACLDVTDTERTLDRLRTSEAQLRALTEKFERIREQERASISREVHDELGQVLTALKIDLTLLARDVGDADRRPDDEAIRASLRSMERLVDSTIDSVRSIATQLRPEVLDAFGLVPAIEWHAGEFEKRTQIRCVLRASGEQPELSADTRTALFRIAQEAMTNAARHAGADRIDVLIRAQPDGIYLSIADNGRGVTDEELLQSSSLGVLGMRERATMVGASFEIRGEPGDGTVVRVHLPVDADGRRLRVVGGLQA